MSSTISQSPGLDEAEGAVTLLASDRISYLSDGELKHVLTSKSVPRQYFRTANQDGPGVHDDTPTNTSGLEQGDTY